MERMPICRICLVENVPMYIVADKNLHELYKTLTDIPFVTEDKRPLLTCYFCFAKLKQCSQLQRKCLKAEELFSQMMNEPNTSVNRGQLEIFSGLTKTPVEIISIVDVDQIESIAVKEEIPAACERLEDVIELKEEHQSGDLELEHADNGYPDVEDTPAHRYSESDSEDDVPLKEFKMEVEEHEVVSEKRRASDTLQAPDAKNPELHLRRTELEDVITEDQTKNEQLDTKVTQNCQNGTSKTVTKYKETLTYTKPRVNNTNKTRIRAGENSLKCDICHRCFSVKTDLTRHILIHTGENPFKCDICQRCFSVKSSLTVHIRSHTGEKPFKCDVCPRCFNRKSSLRRHIRSHTGEKPFKCDVCQRCFNRKSSLRRHVQIHAGEKPFKCDICQRCFSLKSSLKDHIRIHAVEKPFKCDICQRCFSLKRILTDHIRLHTGEKPFKCDVCQRCFTQKAPLTYHIRIHTGEKPFKCDICRRCFTLKSHLTQHIRSHTGEKPFKCDVCQQCFTRQSSLTSHIRIHTGEKPYKCDICQCSFTRKENLTRHIECSHTGEKPFKCDVCQQCFTRQSSLTSHIRIHTKTL